MPGVRVRHLVGAFLGGLVAGVCVLILSSLYSVANGFSAEGPYQGIGDLLGFAGSTAIAVGILVDFVIPLVAAFVLVAVLALLSRTRLQLFEFRTRLRAFAEGSAVGLVIWAVFYVPVIEELSHYAPLTGLLTSLLFGLAEHVAFGAVIGIVVFLVGGPVTFRPRTAAPSGSSTGEGND